MAGARREVDLVIRAKDEASKAVDSVADAFDTLVKSQKNLKQQTAGSDSSLLKLGMALKQLETSFKGLSSDKGLDFFGTKQKQSVADLQAAMSGIGAASDKFGQSMRALAQTTDTLRNKLNGAREALSGQAAVLEKAEAAHRKLEASMTREAASQGKAGQAASTLVQKIAAQESVVAQAATRYADLSQQMNATDAPSKKLAASLESARKALVGSSAGLDAMRLKYEQVQATIRETGENINRLTMELNASNKSAAQQKAIYAQIQANVQKLEQATAKASARQKEYNNVMRASQSAMSKVRGELGGTAAAQERNAGATKRAGQAQEEYALKSRLAMSWTQRLRGEVLALATSYAGVFGALQLARSAVDAFTTLEGATSRLNVVFDGDKSAVAQNLEMVRRTADRLGLSFGVLADEYSKLAASAKGTELEGQKVNEIFIRMSEAVRVNKLGTEAMKGAFMAISQIVTKGVVNMEELRQQLAERFPGAIQLMAAGFGYGADSMDQFFKAVQNGEVKASALMGFADELGKRFGPQLAASLQTTMAQIGFFQNELYKALLVFGDAGFLDGFTNMLKKITDMLKDPAFSSFAGKISKGFGAIAEAIGWAAENFDLLVKVGIAWVSFGLHARVMLIWGGLVKMGRALKAAAAAFGVFRAAAVAMTTTMGTATVAATGLRVAIMGLLSSTGVGIALVAIGTIIGEWVTSIDDASEALSQHQQVVDKVKNAYEEAKRSGTDWRKSMEAGDKVLAEDSIKKLKVQLQELRDETESEGSVGIFDMFSGNKNLLSEISKVAKEFKNGQLSAKQFEDVIVGFKQIDPEFNEKYIVPLIKMAREAQTTEGKIAEAEATVRLMSGAATEADMKLLGLASAFQESGIKAATMKNRFEAALKGIREMVPELVESVKMAEDNLKLDSLIKELQATGTMTAEVMQTISQARAAINTTKEEKDTAKKSADEAKKRAEAAKDFHEQIVKDVDQWRFELSIQKESTVEQEVQKTIRQYMVKAQELQTKLTAQEITLIKQAVTALNQKKAAQEAAEKAEASMNVLLQRRQQLEDQLKMIRAEGGSIGQINDMKTEMGEVNTQLLAAIDNAILMWQAVGGDQADMAVLKLQTARMEAERFGKAAQVGYVDWEKVRDMFTGGFADAIDSFAEKIVAGENAFSALKDAFLSFASDFLRNIAKMIAQAAAFNMLQSMGFNTDTGFMGLFGAGHTGGLVGSRWIGSGNPSRQVSPLVFAGAPRFHDGGLPGLRPGEVPAILKKNEEVLNENDPRNILNGGGAQGGGQAQGGGTKIINTFDAPGFLSAAMSSAVGEKVILNFIKANAGAVKSAIGG
ncbi:MAG: tape measure protein [Alphaproteobacteria bacterium]|nr:tape measure protein [Alphaproteobacteria bacterium]